MNAQDGAKSEERDDAHGAEEQADSEHESADDSEGLDDEQLTANTAEGGPTSPETTVEASAKAEASRDAEREKKSQTIPDLPDPLVKKARAHVIAGRRQSALNTLMRGAKGRGRIEPRLLHRRRMRYAPNINADGFAFYPGHKNGKALPTKVQIGPTAFIAGLSWLYSTMLHEYQHVLQFQARRDSPSKVPGQSNSEVRGNQQETEAYAREIILSRKTGMADNTYLMKETWDRLQSYWQDLSSKGRNVLRKMVDRAREIYKRAIKRNQPGAAASGEG